MSGWNVIGERIPDVRHPDGMTAERIPGVGHPDGMAAKRNSECDTPGWSGGGEGFRV